MAEWKETDSSSLAALTRDTSTLADAAESMQSLVETIWRLRQPDGCPWDREQTHESIAKNMIEEAYELSLIHIFGARLRRPESTSLVCIGHIKKDTTDTNCRQ